MTEESVLRAIERLRLASLVDANLEVAAALHAPEFILVHPSGGTWTKEYYLGGIASGSISYRRFEPVSEIEVMLDGSIAAIRYRSAIEISVGGGEPGPLCAWHLDVYRRGGGGDWQVFWSQATEVASA